MRLPKDYLAPFYIDAPTLQQLLSVAKLELEKLGGTVVEEFTAYLSNGATHEATNVDTLLSMDNSARQRIIRLVVKLTSSPNDSQITIDLDGARRRKAPDSNKLDPVHVLLVVESEDPSWPRATLALLDDQVERILRKDLFHELNSGTKSWKAYVFLCLLVTPLFFGFIYALGSIPTPSSSLGAQTMWLSRDDISDLATSFETSAALTNEQLSDVLKRQVKNIAAAQNRSSLSFSSVLDWRVLAVILPGLALVAAVSFITVTLYPSAVFAWGDAKNWYEGIERRRTLVWGAVVIAFFVSLFSNAVVFVLGPALTAK